jgi:Xaa-Pro aminopeptidase
MLRAAARTLALALCALPFAAQDAPLFTKDFPADEFAARRARLMDAIGRDAIALVQGAPSPPGYTRFRQSNELYYLSGIESPHAYLLIDGAQRRSTLYLPHRNEARERNEGKLLSAEDAVEIKGCAGVEAVFGSDLLAEHLARQARGGRRSLYTPFAPPEGFATSRDLALREVADVGSDPFDGRASRPAQLRRLIQERFPHYEAKDLTPALDALRLIKSPREIALIKKATRLASLAILEAMRSTEPGIMEHELDAVAKYVFYRNGAQGEAYYSLIASGPNAWYPHYNAGKRALLDGELLLMDFAPDVGYYMSDVTRMWPVNGRFSPAQRELYGFYLSCYRSILQAIRPGVTAPAIKQEAAAQMEKLLAAARFQKPAYASAAREFALSYKDGAGRGGLGHWVGMATHDVGNDSGPLRAGMVFTIEPALRVPEEKLYIRLEDLIVIGEQKAEIVSEWLPMDVDAIEKVMREPGMLQRYPRDPGQ